MTAKRPPLPLAPDGRPEWLVRAQEAFAGLHELLRRARVAVGLPAEYPDDEGPPPCAAS